MSWERLARLPFAWSLFPVLIAAGALWPLLGGGFLVDDWFILRRLCEESGSPDPWRYFREPFHAKYAIYRPVVALTFCGDWCVHGLNARGYLLTNVLLHLAGGGLWLALARRMAPDRGAVATSAGMLAFVLFPSQAESVGWIAGRSDVLSWGFGAAGLWFGLKQRPTASLAALCVLLSTLSKESGVAFGAALALWAVLPCGATKVDLKREKSPWFRVLFTLMVAGACFLVLRSNAGLSYDATYAGESLLSKASHLTPERLLRSVGNGFLPRPPGFVPAGSAGYWGLTAVWTGFLLLAVIGCLRLARGRRWDQLGLLMALLIVPFGLGVMANEVEPDLRNSRAGFVSVAALALMALQGSRNWISIGLLCIAAATSAVMFVPVSGRYVECGRAVRRAADSILAEEESIPRGVDRVVLVDTKLEDYFGGLASLRGSLDHVLSPPFAKHRRKIQFVRGDEPGIEGPSCVPWESLAEEKAAQSTVMAARRDPETGTQTYVRLPVLIGASDRTPDARELNPKAGEDLLVRPLNDELYRARLSFVTRADLPSRRWRLVVIDKRGVLVDEVIPPETLRSVTLSEERTWTVDLQIPRQFMKRAKNESLIAWTIVALNQEGNPMEESPLVFTRLIIEDQ